MLLSACEARIASNVNVSVARYRLSHLIAMLHGGP